VLSLAFVAAAVTGCSPTRVERSDVVGAWDNGNGRGSAVVFADDGSVEVKQLPRRLLRGPSASDADDYRGRWGLEGGRIRLDIRSADGRDHIELSSCVEVRGRPLRIVFRDGEEVPAEGGVFEKAASR
jgi:hypothetical protein